MKSKLFFGIAWFIIVTAVLSFIVPMTSDTAYPFTNHILTLIKKGYIAYIIVGIASLSVGKHHSIVACVSCGSTLIVLYIVAVIYEIVGIESGHNLLGIELVAVVAFTLPWLIPGVILDKLFKNPNKRRHGTR